MAGLPWFELDVDFHESPKVRALASRLREPLADAYIARVYAYCYRHARDRFDPEVAAETIEEAARWKGRRSVLFDALFAVEVLKREAGKVVVHGVADRLAPHLAKREADAERQRRRRTKAAVSIGRPPGVTPDVTRDNHPDVTRESRRDKDKDRDKDRSVTVIQPATVVGSGLAGEVESFRAQLEARLGVPVLSVGKDPDSVAAFFASQLAAVGPSALIEECCDLARRSTSGTPSSLRWFVGWLRRLPVPQEANA
jgi:hypothetical protein